MSNLHSIGRLLGALALSTAAAANASPTSGNGILWHNVTSGEFGVWRVGEHGFVYDTFALTTPNPIYPDGYFRCGSSDGCSRANTFPVTELFSTRAAGFDFLSYNPSIGGISVQLSSFAGSVTTPGRVLRNWNGTPALCGTGGCSEAWKIVGTGQYGGLPSLFWYDAAAGLLGAWQISYFDLQTVVGYPSWSACGGSCDAYGTPVGAADVDGDGTADLFWLRSDGAVTVFFLDGAGGHRARAVSQQIPFGYSLVGIRHAPTDVNTTLVWFNPYSGVLQQWSLDPATFNATITTITWSCSGCSPTWQPVWLIPLQ